METKKCTKCLEEKPADHAHFSPSANKKGWQSWCRECHRENGKGRKRAPRNSPEELTKQAAYRAAARERLKTAVLPANKVCIKCKETKLLTDFTTSTTAKEGRHPVCKECTAARQGAWYHEVKDTLEYKQKQKKQHARSYAKSKMNWHVNLFRTAKDRHPARGLSFSLPDPEYLLTLWEQQGGKCYWFGVPMLPTVEKYHPARPSLDRIDSSKGYEVGNVVLSCLAANRGKSDTDPEVWRQFCDKINK
jgi:hypothetical protein